MSAAPSAPGARRSAARRPEGQDRLVQLLKLAGSDSVAGRIDDAVAKVQKVLARRRTIVEAYVSSAIFTPKPDGWTRRIEAYHARSRSMTATRTPRSPGACL